MLLNQPAQCLSSEYQRTIGPTFSLTNSGPISIFMLGSLSTVTVGSGDVVLMLDGQRIGDGHTVECHCVQYAYDAVC